MKLILSVAWSICFFAAVAAAQSPVKLAVNTKTPGTAIPADYLGLSFGMQSLEYNHAGVKGYFFDSTDTQLLTIFRELGVENLRVGGTQVDTNSDGYIPSHKDIDALFRFAKAAGVKVIYSVRLLNGNPVQDASIAKYVWDNYRQYLDCFAIGNEPNIYANMDPQITDFSTYLAKWRRFAAAIIDSVPEAKFGGPDNDTHGPAWGTNFAYYELGSGIVKSIFFHYYVGQEANGQTAQQLIDQMLSTTWVNTVYQAQYHSTGAVVSALGFPYRFTESNSFYTHGETPGVAGGNNSFATALFALDYAYWWAEHGCAGVNFHTHPWKYNGTIYLDPSGNYQVYPIAYGVRAFSIGGHGVMEPVAMSNPDTLNVTSYATSDSGALYITIINKEHGSGGRSANVDITASGFSDSATVVYLTAPGENASDTTGATLGGIAIVDSASPQVNWTKLDSARDGSYAVNVPACSAAIVKIIGTVTSVLGRPSLPDNFALAQNYPNPFNPSTQIKVSLNQAGKMSLKIYNVLGQLVKVVEEGSKPAGEYVYDLNMNAYASGVYFYTLRQESGEITKKMLLLK